MVYYLQDHCIILHRLTTYIHKISALLAPKSECENNKQDMWDIVSNKINQMVYTM